MHSFIHHLKGLLLRNKPGIILSAALSLLLIVLSFRENTFAKTFGYLVTLSACFIVSELILFFRRPVLKAWDIKSPQKELLVLIFVSIISLLLLTIFFNMDRSASNSNRMVMIALMVLRLIFIFPTFLLIYFLAIKKYRLRDLGFRFNNWYVALPLIAIIGACSYLLFPNGLQFKDVLEEHGYLSFITLGLLTAALPEELMRNLFQTRLSTVLNNKSLGWFIVSLIWAVQHIPTFAQSSSLYEGTISALGILPIGLLWGYLNQRYRSILPSVLIHSTNLWGLQNIF